MANVVVLGAGMMGSAFTRPLSDNGHRVSLVGTFLDGDIIEEVHESRRHPRLGCTLSETVVPYTYDRFGEAVQDADLVVVGVNSLGIQWASEVLAADLPSDVPVLLLTKGLEGDGKRIHILPHILRDGLPPAKADGIQMAAVGGPSIAGELATRRPTCVVLTGADAALLERMAQLVRTNYYHVWTNTDFVGVEVAVALKNIYALAVGIVGGLLERAGEVENQAQMYNMAAAIFAQGLREIAYVVRYAGGEQETVLSLPGAGDLFVTSMGGRNGRMGRLLGLGSCYSDAKRDHMPDDTIEGAELALAIGPTVENMAGTGQLDGSKIPLMRMMIQVVCNDAPVNIPWDDFFQ